MSVASDSEYCSHTFLLVVLDGNSWRSVLLYPGILPGRRMACVSAYVVMN